MKTTISAKELGTHLKGWTGDWEVAALKLRRELPHALLSDDAIRTIREKLQKAIASGQIEVAVNWGLLGLVFSDGELVRSSKFNEALRASVCPEHRLPTLAAVLAQLRERASRLPEMSSCGQALADFYNYVDLYRSTRADEAALLQRLHADAKVSLHALLSLAEGAFVNLQPRAILPFAPTFETMSNEDIALGASYALEAYDKAYGLSIEQFGRFKESDPHPRAFKGDGLLAYRLRELIDFEACVYRMGYHCVSKTQGAYEIIPPDERFGMARSLGYARQSQAPLLNAPEIPPDAESFVEACKTFVERLGKKVMVLEGAPGEEALRFQLPEEAFQILATNLILPERYFFEEYGDLVLTCRELLVDYKTLVAFELIPGLSLGDVIRIQRFFRFLALVRIQALEARKADERVFWNSLLGAQRPETMTKLLVSMGFKEKAVRGYLKLFTWRAGARAFLDLQYSPLLQIHPEQIAIPFFILGFSNVVRNGLQVAKARFYSDGRDDPVSKILARAFEKSGAQVKSGLEYDYAGVHGEIDVLVRIGNQVFAFECKNPLLPCSSFEMRTTWDYLEDATLQLNRLKNLWRDEGFRNYLGARLGWDISPDTPSTCIVLSHRLLSGASLGGHPIRQLRELVNLIDSGEIRVHLGDVSHTIRVWHGDHFTVDDLEDYLSESSRIYEPIWKAYFVDELVWKFSTVKLMIPRYAMIPLKYLASFGLVEEALAARMVQVGDQVARAEGSYDGTQESTEKVLAAQQEANKLLKEVQSALARASKARGAEDVSG